VALGQGEPPLTRENSWLFDPGKDPFSAEALLDLRSLNEEIAGDHGFIRRTADGMDFVRGDGKPIRFWSVLWRVDGKKGLDEATMRTFYRMLAKRGVNMVRLFGQLSDNSEGAALEAVDEEQIGRFHKHIAVAREYGVYAMISPYWSHTKAPKSWNIPGLEQGGSPYALLITSRRFRDAYKGWLRELLTRINPDTGRPLTKEPALAIIQAQNEDGIFWYQTQNLPEAQQENLRKAYGKWLAGKYGSVEAALEKWGSAKLQQDSADKGQAGLYIAWELGQPARGDKARRLADQLAFLASHQRQAYAEIVNFLKDDLGCPQLTSASNWRTVDDNLLMDIERYTYTPTDVITLNRYTGPVVHLGDKRGYAILAGDRVVDRSVLRSPENLSVAVKQVVGHPFVLTENSWVFPNRYLAEGPMLIAAYSSLTGVDTSVWSMAKGPNWRSEPAYTFTVNHKNPWIYKHEIMAPDTLGQFPASALAYRRGDIERARKAVVHEVRSFENLWQRTIPVIAEGRSFDPLRDPGDFADQSPVKQEVDPRAFLVGPVTVQYGGNPADSRVMDLTPYVQDHTVQSLTGQIALDSKAGVCRVSAPRYQSVAGFLAEAGGRFELDDVAIQCDNEYAVLSVVSLTDKPIAESTKVLVQMGTLARPDGWRVEPAQVTPKGAKEPLAGYRVTRTGHGHWRIANLQAKMTIANPRLTKATALGPNGYPAGNVRVETSSGKVALCLPPNALYLVLEPR
jgi:hypothetical protein